jgi:hypothetical protein
MIRRRDDIVDIKRLLPKVVDSSFPEIREVNIMVDYGDTGNFFTNHRHAKKTVYQVSKDGVRTLPETRLYTVRICRELADAPEGAVAAAMAIELQQISKKETKPLRYMAQRLWERCSVSHQIRVSEREDIDMVKRGLGGNLALLNDHITENCDYVWNPRDGYRPDLFEQIVLEYESSL